MTREEIHRVFSDLYHNGLRYIFVQGGEPLLRRDLPEILEDLAAIGFRLSLITNGTKFTPALVARLSRISINISISLDTLDRNRYRQIRGADQLPLVLRGMEMLKGFPHPKYLTCIVSEQNHQEAIRVVRFARAMGFMPVVGSYHWNIGRYGKADLALQYKRERAIKTFDRVLESKLVPRGYFRNYLKDNVRWLKGDPLEPCDAGRYSIAIDASGNVAPCLAQDYAGNLLESSLSTVLARFDREAIGMCSDNSSCNLLCSRVIGSTLRNPTSALLTPSKVKPNLP